MTSIITVTIGSAAAADLGPTQRNQSAPQRSVQERQVTPVQVLQATQAAAKESATRVRTDRERQPQVPKRPEGSFANQSTEQSHSAFRSTGSENEEDAPAEETDQADGLSVVA